MDARSTAEGSGIGRLVHFPGAGQHGFQCASGFPVAGNDSQDGATDGARLSRDHWIRSPYEGDNRVQPLRSYFMMSTVANKTIAAPAMAERFSRSPRTMAARSTPNTGTR